MRIGIDARFAGPKAKGLGRYTERLIENLLKIDKQNSYVLFLRPDNYNLFAASERIKKVRADYLWYTVKEQLFFPFRIYREKLDLMHFPHFNVPILYWRKYIVTIHDLIITHFPSRRATTLGPMLYFFKQLAYRFVAWLAVKKAQRIITVSEYSKNEIIKHFSVAPDKVLVTYEAANPLCALVDQKHSSAVLAKHSINKPFILYVGNAHPHKNLERLIKAFEILIKSQHHDFLLVLAGGKDYFYQRLEKETKANYAEFISQRIVFPGFIPDQELAIFYREAEIYVFPSLYEGFGLPPLEAMTCGLPVASSSASCLPEILKNAVVYFDPENEKDIAEKISLLINNQPKKQELREKGFQLTKQYSWQVLAEKTLNCYQQANDK